MTVRRDRSHVPALLAALDRRHLDRLAALPHARHQPRSHRAELERIVPELRRLRDAAIEGDERSQDRLGSLLGYRSFVAEVREWPFDTSTFVRFALYLLIPLGSWFGGAIVERLLGALIDRGQPGYSFR